MVFYIYIIDSLLGWFPLFMPNVKKHMLSCLATPIRLKGETSESELEDEEKDQLLLS